MRRAVVLVVPLVLALAAGPGGADAGNRGSAPEGGPVDDGWLDGPESDATRGAAGPTGFDQFVGEPPPGGGPVWPGVRRDARTTLLADGKPVQVQIIHLDPGADVQVRPSLAGGSVRGLATTAAQSGDPLSGAVAAVNGGFWLGDPQGEPNGFFAIDDRLVSDAETQGAGPRGTVGWTGDGRVLVDRIDSVQQLTLADGRTLDIGGLNRGHRNHDVMFADGVDSTLAYTSDYGGLVVVRSPTRPPGQQPAAGPPAIPGDPSAPGQSPADGSVDLAVLRIATDRFPATGVATGTVVGLTRDEPATFGVDPGEVLVVGTGADATAMDGVAVGDVVVLSTVLRALDPARDASWALVTRALAGGPMVVKDGRMTDPADWVDEGFEPAVHSDVRAPRTAIGVTADGRTIMVVADGRRPGITHGFTIAELAQYMLSLGAVEALSVDGGGSSQAVVDGIMRNVPCCDSSTRRVADSLQVVHRYPFEATSRLQGAGRVETAAAIASASHPGGATDAVIASASGFADALAGGPMAAVLRAPVLLTAARSVPPATMQALQSLGVRTAWLLGGGAVIGPEVEQALAAAGIEVRRVAGDSRFDTAARIAEVVRSRAVPTDTSRPRAFVVPAGTFPDALIAAGPGGILGMPVLLTDGARLHPAARSALAGVGGVVVIDGDGVLGPGVQADLDGLGVPVTRIGGGGRYATAAAVNRWLATQTQLSSAAVVARGGDVPDALAGAPLAAARRAPLMLLPGQVLEADPSAGAWFEEQARAGRIDSVELLGGLAAVTSYEQWQLDQVALRSRQAG